MPCHVSHLTGLFFTPFFMFFNRFFFLLLLSLSLSCKDNPTQIESIKKTSENPPYSPEQSTLYEALQLRFHKGEFDSFTLSYHALQQTVGYDTNFALQKDVELLMGNYYYGQLNMDSCLFFWESALEKAQLLDDEYLEASLLSNLGITYLMKGFNRLAIQRFVAAKKQFEKLSIGDINYNKTILNIAASYVSLKKPQDALNYLNKVDKTLSNELLFLYYLNRLKIAGLLNNKPEIYDYIDSAWLYIKEYPIYQEALDEAVLESYITYKLDPAYNDGFLPVLLSNYKEHSLYYQLLLNKLSLEQYKKTFIPLDSILLLEDNLVQEKDYYVTIVYYDLLSSVYQANNNFEKAHFYLKKQMLYYDSLQENQAYNDLLEYEQLESLQQSELELEKKISSNKLQSEQIKRKNALIVSLSLLLGLLALVLVLFYKNKQKKQFALSLHNKLLQQTVEVASLKEQKLSSDLEKNQSRLNELFTLLSKFAILKKQTDLFLEKLTELSLKEPSLKQELKKAKTEFHSFYFNYQELAIFASVPFVIHQKAQRFGALFPDLKPNDLQILSLILNNYTNNEIATLLSMSKKNVEYYRTKIRKQLEVPAEQSIQSFVEERLSSSQLE